MRVLIGSLLIAVALSGCSNDAEESKAASREIMDVQEVIVTDEKDPQAEQQKKPLDLSLPENIDYEGLTTDDSKGSQSTQFDAKKLFKKKDNPISVSAKPDINYDDEKAALELEGAAVGVEVKTN